MSPRFSLIGALVVALTFAVPARAWVERSVRSDAVIVDVEQDGTATISHEILLAIRGGPLADVSIEPVDADAELLPEATVTVAESGQAAGLPIPLVPTKEGARLSLHVERDRGLRTGVYQVRFQYRTNLASAHRVEPSAEGTFVSWSGPGYPDGIDSARVVFRLPRAATPPRLRAAGAGSAIADDRNGVFLSTFRRAEGKDELEIVRPHVSKGEIVSWSVVVDPAVFGRPALGTNADPKADVVPSPVLQAAPSARETQKHTPRPPIWLLGLFAGSMAGLYGLLVACKAHWVAEACRRSRAVPRPLLPASTRVRVFMATLGVACAFAGAALELPWVAATSLMVALLSAVHLTATISPPLRGPGRWSNLDPSVAFEEPERPRATSGRLFDAGTPLGFILFCSLLVAFAAAALFTGRHSPFHGVAVGLAASLLFPVFCTGREGELHDSSRGLAGLHWIFGALARESRLEVSVIGRMPQGSDRADEVRVLVLPKRPVLGLIAIEVGFDAHSSPIGISSLPFVILRVTDGSPAVECVPKGFLWTRGRSADERVLVLRPKVPARQVACDLARDLARRLSVAEEPGQSRRSAAKSAGNGSSASKGGTSRSPAHAT